jgi:hypothetical protein
VRASAFWSVGRSDFWHSCWRTLSFASDRFNDRRGETLAEANAIGTAWLRAKAIGQPRGDDIAQLLEKVLAGLRNAVTLFDTNDRHCHEPCPREGEEKAFGFTTDVMRQ